MPVKKEDLPSTLKRSPAKVQRTFAKTHDSAADSYGEGERAHELGVLGVVGPRQVLYPLPRVQLLLAAFAQDREAFYRRVQLGVLAEGLLRRP